jgi:hypothetical protein
MTTLEHRGAIVLEPKVFVHDVLSYRKCRSTLPSSLKSIQHKYSAPSFVPKEWLEWCTQRWNHENVPRIGMLYGYSGVGKSFGVETVCRQHGIHLVTLDSEHANRLSVLSFSQHTQSLIVMDHVEEWKQPQWKTFYSLWLTRFGYTASFPPVLLLYCLPESLKSIPGSQKSIPYVAYFHSCFSRQHNVDVMYWYWPQPSHQHMQNIAREWVKRIHSECIQEQIDEWIHEADGNLFQLHNMILLGTTSANIFSALEIVKIKDQCIRASRPSTQSRQDHKQVFRDRMQVLDQVGQLTYSDRQTLTEILYDACWDTTEKKHIQVIAHHWSDADQIRPDIQDVSFEGNLDNEVDESDMGTMTEADIYALAYPMVHQTGVYSSTFRRPVPERIGHLYKQEYRRRQSKEWYDMYTQAVPETRMSRRDMHLDMCLDVDILSPQKLKKLHSSQRFETSTSVIQLMTQMLPLPTRLVHVIQLYVYGNITKEQYVLSCRPRMFVECET